MAAFTSPQNQKTKKKRVNKGHSTEVRERYARGERYSPDARVDMRRKNSLRWLAKAKTKFGEGFNYLEAQKDFTTQKGSKVWLLCRNHKHRFQVLPDKHLQSEYGGCKKCSDEAKREKRLAKSKEKFFSWFEATHKERLSIVSAFQGMTKPLVVECKIHKSKQPVIPSSFMGQQTYGCDKCASEATGKASRLTLNDVLTAVGADLPSNVSVVSVDWDEAESKSFITIKCSEHGRRTGLQMQHLKKSRYVCDACGEGQRGYASNKLRQLVKDGEKGLDASLAVMEIEVFGITALKVGVTTRTLEERYGYHLKQSFFETRLFEVDAYVLENQIKLQFGDQSDQRILKKGMRDGERWSGDTECYWFRAKEGIIEFIKEFIERLEKETPDYEAELGKMVIPEPFPVKRGREKQPKNVAKPVVGLDPQTNKIVLEFASITEARKNGYRNVSMVLDEKYGRQICKGLRWFYKDEFNENDIPDLKPKRQGMPVFCVERNQHFVSYMEAERQLQELGIPVVGSHITSAVSGERKKAGGLSWKKSELSREEIASLDGSDIVDFRPKRASNAKQPVILKPVDGSLENLRFDSLSDAARHLGSQASNLSVARKENRPFKGFWVLDQKTQA